MTRKEMMRRLETLGIGDYGVIKEKIKQGYGAHGISLETTYTLKQINAVFQAIEEGM